MLKYVAEKMQFRSDAGPYESCGVACYQDETLILRIRDLSPSIQPVERLAARCNRLGLSPIHLPDVVEDFLAASP